MGKIIALAQVLILAGCAISLGVTNSPPNPGGCVQTPNNLCP